MYECPNNDSGLSSTKTLSLQSLHEYPPKERLEIEEVEEKLSSSSESDELLPSNIPISSSQMNSNDSSYFYNLRHENPRQEEALSALLLAVRKQQQKQHNQYHHRDPRVPYQSNNTSQNQQQPQHQNQQYFWSDSELAAQNNYNQSNKNLTGTLNYNCHVPGGFGILGTANQTTLSQPAILETTAYDRQTSNFMAVAAYAAARAMAALQNSKDGNYYQQQNLVGRGPPPPPILGQLRHSMGQPQQPQQQQQQHRIPSLVNVQRSQDDYINYEALSGLQTNRLPSNIYAHPSYLNQSSHANYQNVNSFNNSRISPSLHDLTSHMNDFRLLISERNNQIADSNYLPHQMHPNNNIGGYPYHYGFTGQIILQLISGTGLASDNGVLKDLYCVIESDSERKSRSMIRTSCDYFEWNECFEIDVENGQYLALLLYKWDPKTRHRLCFYGGINLSSLLMHPTNILMDPRGQVMKDHQLGDQVGQLSPHVMRTNPFFERIVLQLEPKGLLYLRIAFLPMEKVYARISSHHHLFQNINKTFGHANTNPLTSVLFGIKTKELFDREIRIYRVMRPLRISYPGLNLHRYVPLIIRKCVVEVDRRGIEVVGIYRLSGSILMKLHLRELFEHATASIQSGLINDDYNSIANVISLIDLSPEKVPDIHAITAMLKDFLRELPEPLFTNTLYPMIHDAMQISIPANSQNGAKLMLNILDCLPTSNQEILLYLLDHFKKIIRNSKMNKMTAHHLASCLAPILLYPSPDIANDLDPVILEPARMTAIFKYILDIWPDSRSADNSSVDSTKPEALLLDKMREFENPQISDDRQRYANNNNPVSTDHPTTHRYQQKQRVGGPGPGHYYKTPQSSSQKTTTDHPHDFSTSQQHPRNKGHRLNINNNNQRSTLATCMPATGTTSGPAQTPNHSLTKTSTGKTSTHRNRDTSPIIITKEP